MSGAQNGNSHEDMALARIPTLTDPGEVRQLMINATGRLEAVRLRGVPCGWSASPPAMRQAPRSTTAG